MRLPRRLFGQGFGSGLPKDFAGTLDADEHVLASVVVDFGPNSRLVATSRGLWWDVIDNAVRFDWPLIRKATWKDGVLTITAGGVIDEIAGADVLDATQPKRFPLRQPGKLPGIVYQRVTGSIKSSHYRDIPGGGAWFVQRKIAGRGVVLQVWPDEGTDADALASVVRQVVAGIAAADDNG
ncbi:MAG: hypothetical protein J2O49_06260 [Sciscionella sp.]|nr:hypothetical protein [Sciscionella sp.]